MLLYIFISTFSLLPLLLAHSFLSPSVLSPSLITAKEDLNSLVKLASLLLTLSLFFFFFFLFFLVNFFRGLFTSSPSSLFFHAYVSDANAFAFWIKYLMTSLKEFFAIFLSFYFLLVFLSIFSFLF